jgi:ferredoxin
MSEEIKKHPLSVLGRYYVDYDACLNHEICADDAPNIFKMDRDTWGAYVYKQPETPEEEKQCKKAMLCCPMEAIHDDGDL